MNESGNGALPSQKLREFIEKGFFKNVEDKNISPASIDVTVGSEWYRVDGVFLPKTGESILDLIKKLHGSRHEIEKPLEHGIVYVVHLNESFDLPEDIYAYCNPKSSTGRHDLHVRIVKGGVARYDTLPKGSKGDLWAIVVPRSYPVLLSEGFAISQVRFFNKNTRFKESDLDIEWHKKPLAYHLNGDPYSYESFKMKDSDGSILLRLDLSQDIVGYECRGSNTVVDLGSPNDSIDSSRYFIPIKKTGDSIVLRKDSFYILSTKEALRVPPYLASEMVDMDSRTGEFRTHYAGFFDPGWGCGKDGEGKGRPITLEVRTFEDVIISNGQPIGKVKFERMSETPEIHYDQKNSNYLIQSGPKLAKQFKIPEA
ncbi:MAG: 2'-deoxycytidine 5'-triphosphate deaminase [Candidatus Nomurabacteria bacterium]|nr:2'-deoxycytidine 5'-triphosphate deaminase [Candidatus Nomurabacteria bacterium]